MEASDDVKAFKEFLERDGEIPGNILKLQLNDYCRQSKSMKNALHELIERASEKEDLNAEYSAVGCLLGWIDEAYVLKAIVESNQPVDEEDICEMTHLPKRMVKSIINKLIDEGSVNKNSIICSND
jgi:transcription initiation factor IIE alpha subunit